MGFGRRKGQGLRGRRRLATRFVVRQSRDGRPMFAGKLPGANTCRVPGAVLEFENSLSAQRDFSKPAAQAGVFARIDSAWNARAETVQKLWMSRNVRFSQSRGLLGESGSMRTDGDARHGGQPATSGIAPAMSDIHRVTSALTNSGCSAGQKHLPARGTVPAAVVAATVTDRCRCQLMSSRGRHTWLSPCPSWWPAPQPPPGTIRRSRGPSPTA